MVPRGKSLVKLETVGVSKRIKNLVACNISVRCPIFQCILQRFE